MSEHDTRHKRNYMRLLLEAGNGPGLEEYVAEAEIDGDSVQLSTIDRNMPVGTDADGEPVCVDFTQNIWLTGRAMDKLVRAWSQRWNSDFDPFADE